MRKFWKFLLLAALIIITCLCTYYITAEYSYDGYFPDAFELEMQCYALWLLMFSLLFWVLARKFSRLRAKIAVALSTSVVYTGVVFLLNNFWHYLSINAKLSLDPDIPLSRFMAWDLRYTLGFGAFRYPAVFAVSLSFCILLLLLCRQTAREALRNWFEKLNDHMCYLEVKHKTLSELYGEACETDDASDLVIYVQHMPLTEGMKNEMAHFTTQHKDLGLIRLFLMRYGSMLTRKEYLEFRTMYLDYHQLYLEQERARLDAEKSELPEEFTALDVHFGIETEDTKC